jgi:hypothetical protein
MICDLLESVSEPQCHCLVEPGRGDLHAERHAMAVEAAGTERAGRPANGQQNV